MKYKEISNQYCEKHDQKYADFLKECPICVGERMHTPKEKLRIKIKG